MSQSWSREMSIGTASNEQPLGRVCIDSEFEETNARDDLANSALFVCIPVRRVIFPTENLLQRSLPVFGKGHCVRADRAKGPA
jgi:hypothetical protein